jgi:transposase
MEDLSDFERGQIVGARLAAASVIETAALLGVSRATVFKVMSTYKNHGKISAKRNSGRNSALTERDRFKLGRIFRITAAQVTTERNLHLKNPFSTKTVQRELQKSNIYGNAAIAKPLINESNAQMRKTWCHDHNAWISGNSKQTRQVVRALHSEIL